MSLESEDRDASSFDQRLSQAEQFAREDDHLSAIEIHEQLFQQGLRSQRLYEAAAFSATAAILDSRLPGSWPQARREALYRLLILQPEAFGAAPAFHLQIASKHLPGKPDALTIVARELRPALTALFEAGHREKHLLLMVLLLRSALAGWQSEAVLSAWHRDALPDFDLADMAIPYNCMFDAVTFRANVDDIAALLAATPMTELARRFGPWKLIVFQCITRSRRFEPATPDSLATSQPEAASATPDEAAGLRSLVLRAAALGYAPSANGIADERFAGFLADWTDRCAPLHPAAIAGQGEAARARLQSRSWQIVQALRHKAGDRAPFLKLPVRRRPRIALCISGQLRGYRHAFASWRNGLLRDAEILPVVHSWAKVGRSGAEPVRAFLPFEGVAFCEAYRTRGLQLGLDEMMQRYPALFQALKAGGEVSPGEIGAFYRTDHVVLEDDGDARFAGWSNSRKMHYKIHAADMLSRTTIGDDVDLVLRLRPDKQLGTVALGWADLRAATAAAPVIYADAALGYHYSTLLIGDQLAIGAPGPMHLYADTIDLAPRLAEHEAFACPRDGFVGHVSLAVTCWHAGIAVERLPVGMGALMEADPLSARDIGACLAADAAGRMDAVDQALIGANRADLGLSLG